MRKTRALIKLMFTCGLVLVLIGMFILRQDDIMKLVHNHVLRMDKDVTLDEKNEYYRNYDFDFVQNTYNFSPRSFQDVLNVFYTFLNSGQDTFTFYCPLDYSGCLDDVQKIANDQELLSSINNYVHPYNGFSHIETEYDSFGCVTIRITKSYTPEEIKQINAKIDELYPQLVTQGRTTEENIRSVHDYIINHTRYDSDRSDYGTVTYKSDIAYGPLFEGYAICGGYSDLMELFLERMGIKSYKVSSDNHVWNAVEIGYHWYHLDLTWDDPVASDGKDYLEHSYFLISTKQLLESEKTQHFFIEDYYPEVKEANY